MLRSGFKIHKDPRSRSLTYTVTSFAGKSLTCAQKALVKSLLTIRNCLEYLVST